MSASGHQVTEPPVHHARLYGKVDDSLLFTVVYACELGLLGFLLDHLNLVDYLCRNVLGGKLRVIKEELLPVDHDLRDSLTVGSDGTVRVNLDSRKLLEELLEHVVVSCLERRGAVFDGILLDYNRISYGLDSSGLKHLVVLVHFHSTEIYVLVHRKFLRKRLVAKQVGFQHIIPLRERTEDSLTAFRAEDIFQRGGTAFGGKRDSRELHRLPCLGIRQLQLHGKARLGKNGDT